MSASGEILTVSVEVVGVGLLALLAGASEDTGHLVVLFMVGLWAVFIVTNPGIVSKIAGFPQAAAKAG